MVFIVALVSTPFVIWGDVYVLPLLEAKAERTVALMLISVLLLAADSVAPVPATLVIMFLAANAGWLAGVIGGTLGLTAGVWTAVWVGRTMLGRIAPSFFPESELIRLKSGIGRNLTLTLACWRCVPVLAETTVMLAGAAGIPLGRILRVTLGPNFLISLIYSLAAHNSAGTAALTFVLILALSLGFWWYFSVRSP